MLATDPIKVLSLSNNSHCNCYNATVPHCFTFIISPWLKHCTVLMKLTAVSRAVKLYFRLLFYRPIRYQISLLSASNAATHWRNQLSPSKMYSHGTSRPKPPPLLTRFLFIITPFPQLVNQVSINLGSGLWPWILCSRKGHQPSSKYLSGPGLFWSQKLQHLHPSHFSAHGHFMSTFLIVIVFPFKIVVNKCKLSDFSVKNVFH